MEDFFNTLQQLWNDRGMFMGALGITMVIACGAIVIGFVIGLICASVRIAPKTNIVIKSIDKIVGLYIGIIRGTPTLLQLLIIANIVLNPLFNMPTNIEVPMIAFGINSGAYMAEILRSGFNSVDKGQLEAGRSLGLSWLTTTKSIIVPQAIKNVVPTIFNEIIILVKETSVVCYVAILIGGKQVWDLLGFANKMGNSTGNYMPYLITAAVIYLVVVLILSMIQKLIEWRFRASDRH